MWSKDPENVWQVGVAILNGWSLLFYYYNLYQIIQESHMQKDKEYMEAELRRFGVRWCQVFLIKFETENTHARLE